MTSIRKTKKIIKIGAAAEALNQRTQKLNASEISKVSARSLSKLGAKVGAASKVSAALKGKVDKKLGGTYVATKAATAKKLAVQSDMKIVARVGRTR